MKKALSVLVILSVTIAASAQTTNAPGKAIAIINAAGLKPEVLDAIELAAEKSLNVPFETVTIPPIVATNLLTVHPLAAVRKSDRFPALVMLVNATTAVVSHASYDTNTAISIVNVTAMASDKPDVLQNRLNKQVIRGAVFAFGLEPSADPLCVSRNYQTIQVLDTQPAYLFPPWQDRFEEETRKKGVVPNTAQRHNSIPRRRMP